MLFSLSQDGRISPAKPENDPPQTPSRRATQNVALFLFSDDPITQPRVNRNGSRIRVWNSDGPYK